MKTVKLTMSGPPPKTRPDPRQRAVLAMIANFKKTGEKVWVTNVVTGFYASKVDTEKLRSMLQQQLTDLTVTDALKNWDAIEDWLNTVVFYWAQRTKVFSAKLLKSRIKVSFETEDDVGKYKYKFYLSLAGTR